MANLLQVGHLCVIMAVMTDKFEKLWEEWEALKVADEALAGAEHIFSGRWTKEAAGQRSGWESSEERYIMAGIDDVNTGQVDSHLAGARKHFDVILVGRGNEILTALQIALRTARHNTSWGSSKSTHSWVFLMTDIELTLKRRAATV